MMLWRLSDDAASTMHAPSSGRNLLTTAYAASYYTSEPYINFRRRIISNEHIGVRYVCLRVAPRRIVEERVFKSGLLLLFLIKQEANKLRSKLLTIFGLFVNTVKTPYRNN
jgi:hypothetical protein